MKPVAFMYHRAASVAEACALLVAEPGALLLAGGQTLMPLLAMRLARPTQVVDIGRIAGLDGLTASATHVDIGAMTRQHALEQSRLIAEEVPLLARAVPWIGHPPTRRRGTVGGSLANADPSAEIGLCATALGGEIVLAGAAQGTMQLADFFLGPMTTALPHGAMITALRLRRRADRRGIGTGFREISRRRGDYALAAVAVELGLDASGRCRFIDLAVGGATSVPLRLDLDALLGTELAADAVRAAVDGALEGQELMQDPNASAAYRRRAAVALAAEAVAQAVTDAQGRR